MLWHQNINVFKNVCLATTGKICSGASYFPLKATLGIQVTKDDNDYDKYYYVLQLKNYLH